MDQRTIVPTPERQSVWRDAMSDRGDPDVTARIFEQPNHNIRRESIATGEMQIRPGCRQLLESYKEAAIRSLPELHNASLKGLNLTLYGKQDQ